MRPRSRRRCWPPAAALASSHREAPFITELPKVDNTDVYAFRSYEPGRESYTTLITNFQPFQEPWGGPNYYFLDDDALYEIHVDNNGDAKHDIVFQFRFNNNLKNIALQVGPQGNTKEVAIPLINAGPISDVNPDVLNIRETYSVSAINVARSYHYQPITNAEDQSKDFDKPVDNIGNKSLPDYAAYAAKHIYNVNIPGCDGQGRVFVGQRKEGFQINVGEIFDLVNIPAAQVIGDRSGQSSATANSNITTMALEVPTACLVKNAKQPIIGVWSTASLPRNRHIHRQPESGLSKVATENGDYRQVSRLGSPLVNELVIGLKDKDRFNTSKPNDDAQFLDYVTNPTLPELLEMLFADAGVKAPDVFPRADLIAAFVTGVPGVNKPENGKPGEMQRLNTAIPVTPVDKQNNLGALQCFVNGALKLDNTGCDPAGFPNGRRPGDDVVDIELRVAMGALLPPGSGKPASADLPYTDGALVDVSQFDNAFPYLATPLPGSPNGKNGVAADPIP